MSDEYMEQITQDHMDQAHAVDDRRTQIANDYYDNVKYLPNYTKNKVSLAMLRDILRHMVYPAVFGDGRNIKTQCRCNALEPLPICAQFLLDAENAVKCTGCGHAESCHG